MQHPWRPNSFPYPGLLCGAGIGSRSEDQHHCGPPSCKDLPSVCQPHPHPSQEGRVASNRGLQVFRQALIGLSVGKSHFPKPARGPFVSLRKVSTNSPIHTSLALHGSSSLVYPAPCTDNHTFSAAEPELRSPFLPAMWARPSLESPSTSSPQALPISWFQFSHRLPKEEAPWRETAAVPRCGQTTEKESKNESGRQHPRAPWMGTENRRTDRLRPRRLPIPC